MESDYPDKLGEIATDLRWQPDEEGEYYLNDEGEVIRTQMGVEPLSGHGVIIAEPVGTLSEFKERGFGPSKVSQETETAPKQPSAEHVRTPVFAEVNLDKADEKTE